MVAHKRTVELVNTKEIELFLPLMREIDFGDKFLLSMLHWCGIGHRSNPLEYWQVFLVRSQNETVGVSGLYRQPGMPPDLCWLGWFAIRPKFRRRGLGSAAIDSLATHARMIDCKEIWVYTGADDHIARDFYISVCFEVIGPAHDWAHGRTTDPSDVVLRRKLIATEC
jgi:ribosomal protein S18 acetylase RimI-like enzyme